MFKVSLEGENSFGIVLPIIEILLLVALTPESIHQNRPDYELKASRNLKKLNLLLRLGKVQTLKLL